MGDVRRQRPQIGLLQDVSLLRAHAQTALGFLVRNLATPDQGLGVEVLQVKKGSAGEKVAFHVSKWPLHPAPVREEFMD